MALGDCLAWTPGLGDASTLGKRSVCIFGEEMGQTQVFGDGPGFREAKKGRLVYREEAEAPWSYIPGLGVFEATWEGFGSRREERQGGKGPGQCVAGVQGGTEAGGALRDAAGAMAGAG